MTMKPYIVFIFIVRVFDNMAGHAVYTNLLLGMYLIT